MARRVFKGWISLKVTQFVTGGLALNTQVNIPGIAYPLNPNNIARPASVNAAGEPSLEMKGKKTPRVRVVGFPKSGWFSASLFNTLIMLLDGTTGNTAGFAIGLNDTVGTRVYDICRCEQILMTGNPTCGPITLDFKGIYGENEAAVPTTFTPPSATTGQLYKAKETLWSAGADKVREWGVLAKREQGWDFNGDGTDYANDILSGGLAGALTLGQDPDFSASPQDTDTTSGTATLKLGSTGAGVQFDVKVSNDEDVTPHEPAIVTRVRTYSFINKATGSGMLTVSAL